MLKTWGMVIHHGVSLRFPYRVDECWWPTKQKWCLGITVFHGTCARFIDHFPRNLALLLPSGSDRSSSLIQGIVRQFGLVKVGHSIFTWRQDPATSDKNETAWTAMICLEHAWKLFRVWSWRKTKSESSHFPLCPAVQRSSKTKLWQNNTKILTQMDFEWVGVVASVDINLQGHETLSSRWQPSRHQSTTENCPTHNWAAHELWNQTRKHTKHTKHTNKNANRVPSHSIPRTPNHPPPKPLVRSGNSRFAETDWPTNLPKESYLPRCAQQTGHT